MFVNLLKSFNIENVYSKYDHISYLLDVFLLKYMRIQLYPNLHFECRAELARGRTYSAADLPRRCLHLVTKTDFAKTCISHVDNVQFYLVFGESFVVGCYGLSFKRQTCPKTCVPNVSHVISYPISTSRSK